MSPKIYLFFAFALVISYAIGRYHARYRSQNFQNRGEALVSRAIQKNFKAPDYHLLNHITLQLKDGTTQIDHILLSRFGVFVLETKHYSGWIFANVNQETWTQVIFRKKFRFQNPIFQNMRHVEAVKNALDFLPSSAIKSLVVFSGESKFKTDIPPNVLTLSDLIQHLSGYREEIISLNRMQFCVGRLETLRLAISGETDLAHIKNLERLHGGMH